MRLISEETPLLVIGSFAFNYWYGTEYKDIDIYSSIPLEVKDSQIDLQTASRDSGIREFVEANKTAPVVTLSTNPPLRVKVAKPTTLLLIKKLHSLFRQKWQKNISDYFWLKEIVKSNPSEEEIKAYEVRKLWVSRAKPIPPITKLNVCHNGVILRDWLKLPIKTREKILESNLWVVSCKGKGKTIRF